MSCINLRALLARNTCQGVKPSHTVNITAARLTPKSSSSGIGSNRLQLIARNLQYIGIADFILQQIGIAKFKFAIDWDCKFHFAIDWDCKFPICNRLGLQILFCNRLGLQKSNLQQIGIANFILQQIGIANFILQQIGIGVPNPCSGLQIFLQSPERLQIYLQSMKSM